MIVIGIDPGTVQSAYVVFDGAQVLDHGIAPNPKVAAFLRTADPAGSAVAFEKIEGMGMTVGREVFETIHWTGRFYQVARDTIGPKRVFRIPRTAVKLQLCRSRRAKDPHIRRALLNRFGGPKAQGSRSLPGPLFGITSHEWSALAVAVTWWDTDRKAFERNQQEKVHATAVV
ncbi:MAG: hypothetical protein AB7I50_00730 [Vicinamibacterales bacterium]